MCSLGVWRHQFDYNWRLIKINGHFPINHSDGDNSGHRSQLTHHNTPEPNPKGDARAHAVMRIAKIHTNCTRCAVSKLARTRARHTNNWHSERLLGGISVLSLHKSNEYIFYLKVIHLVDFIRFLNHISPALNYVDRMALCYGLLLNKYGRRRRRRHLVYMLYGMSWYVPRVPYPLCFV